MKRTVIDLDRRTEHHLLSGRIYQIDRRLERRGSTLYLDRTFVRHESIAAVRSVLLPEQNLWILFYEGHSSPCEIRCYMHMARILDRGETVTVEDLYLDVLVQEDGQWQLVDVDEFRNAVARGELTSEQVLAALVGLEHACRLVQLYGREIEQHLTAMAGAK